MTRRRGAEPLEGMPSGNLQAVARGRHAPSRRRHGAVPAGRVRGRPPPGLARRGRDEYGKPEEFFRRTFLTEGLRDLLLNASRRLRGEGGDPVVQLQTNFGGGKTHSLIALYHLAGGYEPAKLPGVEMLADVGLGAPPEASRVVLVGQMIDPGKAHEKESGTTVQTLWGELAWQLGGPEGYAIVESADKADESWRTDRPAARRLLAVPDPDRRVGRLRAQLYGRDDLPAGTFDTQMTFAQALSDAAKNVKNAMLVVSIPASDIEVGGEASKEALEQLSNVIFRQEASWKPASAEEFEIVRKGCSRTSPPSWRASATPSSRASPTCTRSTRASFPPRPARATGGVSSRLPDPSRAVRPSFRPLVDARVPAHAGVLRLMAAIIELWNARTRGFLIMPASVPIDAPGCERS